MYCIPYWNEICRLCIAVLCPICVLFVSVLCLVSPMLPLSLDCPFLIAPSVFSNVYLKRSGLGGGKSIHRETSIIRDPTVLYHTIIPWHITCTCILIYMKYFTELTAHFPFYLCTLTNHNGYNMFDIKCIYTPSLNYALFCNKIKIMY